MSETIYESGEYLQTNPTWHVEDASWKAKQVVRMLSRNRIQPATVCEIGCGAGAVLEHLQNLRVAAKFYGYDISPQALGMAQTRANEQLEFTLGGIAEIEARRQQFDVLLLLDVVEHVEDHMRFLRESRPLGHVKIFHFPLDLSVQSILRGIPSKVRRTAGHLHYFTKQLVLQTLEDANYRVVDLFYTPAALECQSPSLPTRLMRVPRRFLHSITPDGAALWLGGYSLLVLAI